MTIRIQFVHELNLNKRMLSFVFCPTVGGLSLCVCECQDQDKKVTILNLSTGKTIQYFKPEGDFGEPLKVLPFLTF